ncbi:prisilkin-39 [Magallana gigas]|uniref:prisilkin-39 n=1 Tax=Magallana gigas TaxID=29159 RepID=UPI00333EF581
MRITSGRHNMAQSNNCWCGCCAQNRNRCRRHSLFGIKRCLDQIQITTNRSSKMHSSAVVAALLVLGVALVRADMGYSSGGYDQSGYTSGYASGYDQSGYTSGYTGGYAGGYDSGYGYSTGISGYGQGMSGYGQGLSGYGHGSSGYGHGTSGYGHKKSMKSVYVPYPVPVEAPVQQPLPLPALGLGVGAETTNQGIFGGNGALLLGLLALTPILLNNNNSG